MGSGVLCLNMEAKPKELSMRKPSIDITDLSASWIVDNEVKLHVGMI